MYLFLQKNLYLYSLKYLDMIFEAFAHELECWFCWYIRGLDMRYGCIKYTELISMAIHPEVQILRELTDKIHEPLLIIYGFFQYPFACLLDLLGEMDDTCWDISDILYSYFRISVVHVHIWEHGWVEVHESGFACRDTRLRKKKHQYKDTHEYHKNEKHRRYN